MSNVDMAKQNYGRTWTKEMLKALVVKNKLTAADYKEITGEDYTA